MRRHIALILLLWPLSLHAQSVSVKNGDVFFTSRDSRSVQITFEGLDSAPSLSSDSKRVVFVRRTPDFAIDTGRGDAEDNELWVASVDPIEKPYRVLRGHPGTFNPNDKLTLAGFYSPQFSSDSLRVYFMATTWATSDAIHVLKLSTGKTEFLESGHSVEPIYSGQFKNHVILRTDVMPRGGGHLMEYWLFDQTGKRLRVIGQEPELQKFKEANGARK